MSEQLLTCAEAAEVLGMSESGVYKLISKGVLPRRHNGRRDRQHDGIVTRADVERVAADRAQAAAELEQRLEARRRPRPPRTPDDAHDWLGTPAVADLLGITTQAVAKRCRKGTIPATRVGQQWWVRAEHARIAANVRATDGPEMVAVALDGIE